MLEPWLRQRATFGGELGGGQARGPVALHVRDWGCAASPPYKAAYTSSLRPHTLVA
jgi:hypothetical protein